MGVLRRLRLRLCFAALALLLASVSATELDTNRQFSFGTRRIMEGVPRRLLVAGPGSWPPSCISKCGRCTPCAAVHVPIRPGTSTTLEYYPEAWRCKCGDKMFIP